LDLNSVPILKEKSHLPVVVDPSHGIGIRDFVEPMALAAVAAGADGILMEIHQEPEKAASDGAQTLNFEEASRLIQRCRSLFDLRSSW
jgi:3-deoxy-7-phosphoheptulonate synthase